LGAAAVPTELVNVQSLRRIVETTWDDVARWFTAKPRIFSLPHPEQQILFEYADRVRAGIRSHTRNHSWDRLYFDGSSATLGGYPLAHMVTRRPPIYLDTRQLYGLTSGARDATAPDIAVAIQVLRSTSELIDLDDDGRPRHQSWMPTNIRAQGMLLEQHVEQLEELSRGACDGFLFVVYSNDARRRTAVDLREVASWASWQPAGETLYWAARHFRASRKA
jgi:hypothetical protein